jgi:hypothetical protein
MWRWALAFLVSLTMLLAMTGVAVFAQTGSAGGPVFVPATAMGFGELRLDLPGDQHDQLAAFMAHLPGFADPASFDTKLDQALDQVLSSSTGGATTWTGGIKTWSNGQVAVGVLGLPDPATAPAGTSPSLVVGVGVKDRAALESWFSANVAGPTPVTEVYSGTTITSVGTTSFAITDQYLLISPAVADIKTSLDVLAGTTPSLADDPGFQAAATSMGSPNLGEFYITTASLKPLIEQQLSTQSGGAALIAQLANLPAWVGGYAQVAADHLTVGASVPVADGGTPSVRETDLAAHYPSGTLLYLEVRDLGKMIDGLLAQVKTQLAADPKYTKTISSLEQQFGPLDQLLAFVQDGAVGVSFDGQQLSAGIVATLSNEAVAKSRLQLLTGLLGLLAGGDNSPFTVSLPDANGVTTITLKPTANIPSDLPFTPAISIGVKDGHLYLGLGDFASTAIAQDPANSLATDPRYSAALTEAGTPNGGVIWVDLAAAAPLVANITHAADDPNYTTNIKPWIDALDYLVSTATVNGDVASLKALLFVK